MENSASEHQRYGKSENMTLIRSTIEVPANYTTGSIGGSKKYVRRYSKKSNNDCTGEKREKRPKLSGKDPKIRGTLVYTA